MTSKELIAEKLNKLNVYNEWIIEATKYATKIFDVDRVNKLIEEYDGDWESFIGDSFPWDETELGFEFWYGISLK